MAVMLCLLFFLSHAKLLVEDTIRRNASPIRENADTSELGVDAKEHTEFGSSFSHLDNQSFVKKQLVHSYSMSDASMKEYCIPVHIGHDVIKLSGNKSELLKTAKLVLTEYFAGQTKLQEKQYESLSSMSIQSPSENSMQRFELQRQPSLKKNMLESLSSSRMNDSSKRESISPFSSSDDDVGKDDVNIGLEKDKAAQVLPFHVSLLNAVNTKKTQSSAPVEIPTTQGNFNQSASIPKDYSSFDSFSDSQEQFKEESPVMFDPSKYRQKDPQFEDSSADSYK
ncbi:uncharacterized protein LOC118198875 isoform X2 [Stegodyphus dumicola]|uniref:uncharacterized protein LOC118198875 isoform X2 n=1 Tax=Stegodyphus dumicola TaxID=202533 RepID=UPI0015A7DF99|nr:uncharacterized protein LOC118198875 isoform X2 [Stegodyphus dumicola]